MKILFVTTEFSYRGRHQPGGLANYLGRMAGYLTEHGHDVSVLMPADDLKKEYSEKIGDLSVMYVPTRSIWKDVLHGICGKKFWNAIEWLVQSRILNKKVRRLYEDNCCDVVQYSSYMFTGFCAPKEVPAVLRISSSQYLIDSLTGISPTFSKRLVYYLEEKTIKKNCSYCPSKIVSDYYSQKIKKKIDLIETPIWDETTAEESLSSDRADIPDKYIFFFGKDISLKGFDLLLDVLPDIMESYNDVKFVHAGPKCDEIEYRWMEESSWYRYVGSVEHILLYRYIQNAALVVLPSKIENFSNAVLETLVHGPVLVATTQSGAEQLIENGVSGFLVPPDDPAALSSAIRRALNLSMEDKREMGVLARKSVERLAPERIIPQVINLYKTVIDEKT